MAKEKKQTKKAAQVKQDAFADNCGPVPKNPGLGDGDWQCRDGKWVWIENIGG